jgi:hypothetical protein
MERTDMGNVRLNGSDSRTWTNDEWKSDLAALKSWAADDFFFHWMYDTVLDYYHRILGRQIKVSTFQILRFRRNVIITSDHLQEACPEEHLTGTVIYSVGAILRLTRAATTVAACMLPIISIVLLYVIESMTKRLGIIAAFTALFSFALAFMTSAGMADIFAATAA